MDRETVKKCLMQKSILFVDDDNDITEAMNNILTKYFDRVYISNEATNAIDLYKNNNIDIVVSDVTMSGLNGIEMAEELSKYDNNLKIIFITGHNEDFYINQIIKYTDYYLIKPIKYKLLLEHILKILEVE